MTSCEQARCYCAIHITFRRINIKMAVFRQSLFQRQLSSLRDKLNTINGSSAQDLEDLDTLRREGALRNRYSTYGSTSRSSYRGARSSLSGSSSLSLGRIQDEFKRDRDDSKARLRDALKRVSPLIFVHLT